MGKVKGKVKEILKSQKKDISSDPEKSFDCSIWKK